MYREQNSTPQKDRQEYEPCVRVRARHTFAGLLSVPFGASTAHHIIRRLQAVVTTLVGIDQSPARAIARETLRCRHDSQCVIQFVEPEALLSPGCAIVTHQTLQMLT